MLRDKSRDNENFADNELWFAPTRTYLPVVTVFTIPSCSVSLTLYFQWWIAAQSTPGVTSAVFRGISSMQRKYKCHDKYPDHAPSVSPPTKMVGSSAWNTPAANMLCCIHMYWTVLKRRQLRTSISITSCTAARCQRVAGGFISIERNSWDCGIEQVYTFILALKMVAVCGFKLCLSHSGPPNVET